MSVRCQFIFVLACNKPNCVRKQGAEKWAIELDAAESWPLAVVANQRHLYFSSDMANAIIFRPNA